METDNSPIEEITDQFKIEKTQIDSPLARMLCIDSAILALPESFCIKEGFPTSGNNKQNIMLRSKASGNFSVKISKLINCKFAILNFVFLL
jgi:hypothetical protein